MLKYIVYQLFFSNFVYMRKKKFNINRFQRAGAKDKLVVWQIEILEYQSIVKVRTNFGQFYFDSEIYNLYYAHKDCVFGYAPILHKSVWEVIASAMDKYSGNKTIIEKLTETIKTKEWQ